MGSDFFLVSRDDWSLHRKGQLDQQRHQERVREAIKQNLADLVSEESIIMSDGKKIVKVPIRSLEEYKFRFDLGKRSHAGTGSGGSKPGDALGKAGQGPTAGSRAGEEPGVDYYEAEVTIDELAELIFEDLGLPRLEPRKRPLIENPQIEFNDVRKTGLMGNLDKRRTLLEALKRNALHGEPKLSIQREDLRFKTWEERIRHESNAVVLAMMDTSGSMGNFEKYIARSFFFWAVRFLRTKYHNVQILFLAHDTRAREVTEDEFFSKGESGGTKCSSVYELALQIIHERFPPHEHNIYPFHFSDGDNFPADNPRCVQLVEELLKVSNVFGYGEIVNSNYYHESTLMQVYSKIQDPRFICVTIKDKSEVYPALKAFFKPTD